MDKLRLVVADANESRRAQLKLMLQEISGIELAGEATDLGSAIATLEHLLPDLLIIGNELPQGKDFVVRSIRSLFPSIRILELAVLLDAVPDKPADHAPGHLDRDKFDKIIAGSSSGPS